MFFKSFLLISTIHCVLSHPGIPDIDRQPIKLENLGGNQYFQATQQIFYTCKNNDTKPNEESQEQKQPEVPKDYIITPGIGAHKYHLESKNWNEARNECRKEGAHLAIILSEAEENLIKKWVNENKVAEAWLGYHELFRNDDWVTVLDESIKNLKYLNWKKGEPNHLGGVEHCVTYMQNGPGLNDKNCDTTIPFVCKIDLP